MIVKSAELEIVCGPTSKLPDLEAVQIAFAGKSNVGKSSLINALLNRKALARTSSQPGKTQTINFYNINKEFYFVDLPGYGFAKASKESQEKWGMMVEKYLNNTPNLKAVFLLVDIRHEAKANDKMMYQWIVESGYQPIVICTKADKIGKNEAAHQLKVLKEGLELAKGTVIIPVSSETKAGISEVWNAIEQFL